VKLGVLFLNFGGPTQDDQLAPFLRNLFEDVLPGPGWWRRFLANQIGTRRAELVRPVYRAIGWSPLVPDTERQASAVAEILGDQMPPWEMGMMFSQPTVREGLERLKATGCDSIVALALYPQYAIATTGSVYDMVARANEDLGLNIHYAKSFYNHPAYIRSVANTIRAEAIAMSGDGPIHLLFSAHGVPTSYLRRGDPYARQTQESVRAVVKELGWTDPWSLGWQSRVGPVRWLTPGTPEVMHRIASSGDKRLLMVPVSFVGEHIETLDEMDREYKEEALEAGIEHFGRAKAVGMDPDFIACLADLVRDACHQFDREHCVRCLGERTDWHRANPRCPNCNFETPLFQLQADSSA